VSAQPAQHPAQGERAGCHGVSPLTQLSLHTRHHFLDTRLPCRAGVADLFTSLCRAISAASCRRSSTRKCDRPADVTSNAAGAAALVQAAGRRLSLLASA
jgi:hypothetical protein